MEPKRLPEQAVKKSDVSKDEDEDVKDEVDGTAQ